MRVWERREDESTPAYEAFVSYRDMGAQRSTARVAQVLSKSKGLMDRWSGSNGWVERALAWDAEQDRRRQKATLRTVEQMAARHARLADTVIRKISRELRAVDVDKLSLPMLLQCLKMATDLERQAMGADTTTVEIEHHHQETLLYLEKLSSRELAIMAKRAIDTLPPDESETDVGNEGEA